MPLSHEEFRRSVCAPVTSWILEILNEISSQQYDLQDSRVPNCDLRHLQVLPDAGAKRPEK
jgi:hypothetical protein